jgi:hypothetical protein
MIIARDASSIARFLFTDAIGRLYVLLSDGTTTAVIDPTLSALVTIDGVHRQVHLGNFFVVSRYFAAIAAAGTADLRVLVGAAKALHVTISVAAGANANVDVYEGTTYTAAGAAVTIYDRNRTTANASTATAFHTPTVLVLGTNLFDGFCPGGSKQSAMGSVRSNGQEWIFKKSTDYLIRVTNVSAGNADYSIEVEWYEV